MKRPRWTLRRRLWAIVGLAFVHLVGIALVDRITTARLLTELDSIQRGYVPLLKYGPAVEAEFTRLRRAMQDAVVAQDLDALAATAPQRERIEHLLDHPPSAVTAPKAVQLREAFATWSNQAYRLSERLVTEPTGEELMVEIEAMQSAQRTAWEVLQQTVFLDEEALSRAFESARRAKRTANRTRTTAHVVLFGSIAVLMLLIGRRVLPAFAELRRGFARFGQGDFSRPVAITGADELARLGAAANQMASHIDELQRGLRSKQRALEQANRELESFSYSVSHDLRAPLRGIDGFSQALLEDHEDQLDETGKDYLHRVRAAAQRMGELIDDLLALSRIGRTAIRREPVDVSALAEKVARELQATEPSRVVEWDIAAEVAAEADPRLVTALLENLLGNAWKFTSKCESARIELGQTLEGTEPVYFVRDDGAGFDMAYSDKLFGAFQRLHRQSEFEGTGIGLATVNRIVRKHGGRIWAEGEVGKGAAFFFTLSEQEEA